MQYISNDGDIIDFFVPENEQFCSTVIFLQLKDSYQVTFGTDMPNGCKEIEIKLISKELFNKLQSVGKIELFVPKEFFDYDPLCEWEECNCPLDLDTIKCSYCDYFYHKRCMSSEGICDKCYDEICGNFPLDSIKCRFCADFYHKPSKGICNKCYNEIYDK